jgi:6-phosphofructokinase
MERPIDNDVGLTERSIGCDMAVNIATGALKTTKELLMIN